MNKVVQNQDLMKQIMSFHKKPDALILHEIKCNFMTYREDDEHDIYKSRDETENELKVIEKKIYEIYRLCLRDYTEEVFEAYILLSEEQDMFFDVSKEDFEKTYLGEYDCVSDFIDSFLEDNGIEVSPLLILDYEDMWQENFLDYSCCMNGKHFFKNE